MIDFLEISSPFLSVSCIFLPISAIAVSQEVLIHLPSPLLEPGALLSGKGILSGSYICDCAAYPLAQFLPRDPA